MAFDMPYRAIYARNTTTCSIGSEPSSYASSIGRRKRCGIGVSWISWTKGEPQRKLSTRSSFVLIVLWMSLILWFTKHNCALKELVEYESVSESSKLRTDELGVGASRLATLPKRGCPWKASGVTTGVPRFIGGGVSPGSLNKHQYHPGVCKGRFPSPNKGSGGCGASLEVGCIMGETFSPRLPSAELLVISCPPSSANNIVGYPIVSEESAQQGFGL
ncbi:hypothetical protein BHE74_00025335 [Ensete ventricosum]|nr:hypothetical protein BHE74_00025335 [Ensete ventricosum]